MLSEDLTKEVAESPAKVSYLLRLAVREIHFLARRAACPFWEALRTSDQVMVIDVYSGRCLRKSQVCAELTSAGN